MKKYLHDILAFEYLLKNIRIDLLADVVVTETE